MSLNEQERLAGIVERVTFHSPETGWTVLKVSSFREPNRLQTVLVHQAKIFAGATMEFWGNWTQHPKHGEQFKATRVVEKKPATSAALEKYLGSGLIRGVGPQTARKIVAHFRDRTLEIFESHIDELMEVPGIAERKLAQIKTSWEEHRAVRDVMMFLQNYGISTLFAVKIFKAYGDRAIQIVSANPYRLAHDIYGIGFFSADRIALAMGFAKSGVPRTEAGIKHVLAASREQGHCYLTEDQIITQTNELLEEGGGAETIRQVLASLLQSDQIKQRVLSIEAKSRACYYSKTLYYDEESVAQSVRHLMSRRISVDEARVFKWVDTYCQAKSIQLSDEQRAAVGGIVGNAFSVLTGGPGCGKTTTTRVLVQLLRAMQRRVVLAAPTGRAAQRMSEVIGLEARTLHRLLEWSPQEGGFKKCEQEPLQADFLIIDECSMLDVSLAAAVLKAVPRGSCQVLFIGDPDQLPAVGAGQVLSDLLGSQCVPRFRLTQVFRQAAASSIIRYAHEINSGRVPKITSPLAEPEAFARGADCLFLDSEEATQEQLSFMNRAKEAIRRTAEQGETHLLQSGERWLGRMQQAGDGAGILIDDEVFPESVDATAVKAPVLTIPEKLRHVDLTRLATAQGGTQELMAVLKSVHPWSSLHFGLTGVDSVVRLYTKSIREWLGAECEIQVLTPQVRGTLGTLNLNTRLQQAANPPHATKKQIQLGEKILRVGDRVIQTRNNYNLNVFNGDIGSIVDVDTEEMNVTVRFLGAEAKTVSFAREDLPELQLAYAITIHKSQGSEFGAVIIPVVSQHFNMLFRNLIYTGLTRAKKLAIFVGSRKAFALAVHQVDNRHRQTALKELLPEKTSTAERSV